MDIILYLLIGLWLVWIDDKYFAIGSSEVHINGNITAEVNSNDIKLECSFTLGEGDVFFSTALTAENATTDKYIEIAGYLRNTKPLFTPFGMDLFGNKTTLIHFDENHNMFTLAFDNVTCRHERRYKCLLLVTSSISVLSRLFESEAIWISVTVPPSKPEMNFPTKVNDLSGGGNRNKRSATITPKNDTREQDFLEGDNITFMCEGDVGRPEGSIEWQKIYANDENLTFSNTITETIPESCSNEGNSTLTMQVTGDDNQAIIRCIVKSEVSHVFLYDDSEPLRIQFQVRIPVIELQPDKTVFPEGDSVQLKCQSEGNPSPSYSWLKGNGSNETIIAYTDSFVIENSNITDSGLYTCYTNNSIDGNVYKAFKSIYISIENTNDLSEDKNNSSENNHNILIGIGIAGGFLIIFAFIIAPVIYRRRAKSERLLKDKGKTTSKSFSENCAKNNPCYTSDSGTRSNDNLNDSGNAMATRNNKLENKEKLIGKQKNKEIELANLTKQTNNEAASYAYVTVSSDYHAEKETKFDSYEKFKPSTINEKNIPSTSSSSKYAKENLNENSLDHYASSVPDVYDVLHDNRYKTDKGEAYDRMSELKRLPENRKKSNQQTNSDPKSSFKYNQTGPQNNQAFESEEYQQVDSVSLDSIEDNGSKQ